MSDANENCCTPAGGIEMLNQSCRCLGVDETRLQAELARRLPEWGLPDHLGRTHPHLFSHLPLFVSSEHLETMAAVVAALETTARTSAYRAAVMEWAPAEARMTQSGCAGLLGCDFHLGAEGPRLIEINTNPGGALLNTVLARAQRVCCGVAVNGSVQPAMAEAVEAALLEVFVDEWRASRPDRSLRTLAIVDEDPERQFLYPEFLLYRRLFERAGLDARICDPGELVRDGGLLRHRGEPVDFVYNRLTDFALASSRLAPLREAWRRGEVVLSPSPPAHALYADKRNLALLGDREFLRKAGLGPEAAATLSRAVPRTAVVTPEDRERLWKERRRWFFKPARGYGSRAAYRGDKLTRRVWDEIAHGEYVAQEIVAPSERIVAPEDPAAVLKADVRCYAYRGTVLLVAARLYRGQTTNFRTEGGGFAPVFSDARHV